MPAVLLMLLGACSDPPPPPPPPPAPEPVAAPAPPPPLRVRRSAGSATVYVTAGGRACADPSAARPTDCHISRVPVDLDDNLPRPAEPAVRSATSAVWGVQVSPDGAHLAFLEGGAAGAVVRVRPSTERDPSVIGEVVSTGLLDPAGVAWLSPTTVLVHQPDATAGCAPSGGGCGPIAGWHDVFAITLDGATAAGASRQVVGNERTSLIGLSYLSVIPGSSRVLGMARTATGAPPRCEDAATCGAVTAPQPRFVDLETGATSELAITGPCADPTPVPGSARIVCVAGTPTAPTLVTASPTRDAMPAAELLRLPRAPEDLSPLGGAAKCTRVDLRSPRMCDDDHVAVIASCVCEGADCGAGRTDGALAYARAFLVDVSDPNEHVWTDLLAGIEATAGVDRGALFARDLVCTDALLTEGQAPPTDGLRRARPPPPPPPGKSKKAG